MNNIIVYENEFLKIEENKYIFKFKEKIHYSIHRKNSVIIIPIITLTHTLLLEHYRFPLKEYSWEFPMGGIEDNESPEIAAKREFFEETGIVIDHLKLIGEYYPVPGLSNQKVFIFITIMKNNNYKNQIKKEFEEEIKSLQIITLYKMKNMFIKSLIADGYTISALHYLSYFIKNNKFNINKFKENK